MMGKSGEHEKIEEQTAKKKASVVIRAPEDEERKQLNIVTINEKHGPLRNAIPCMPMPLAVLCCLFNICIPGLGTFISSFSVFCCGETRIQSPIRACLLNLLSAFLQMLTFLLIVGWIWSILWGMTFVQLAQESEEPSTPIPYYVRRQSSVE